MFANGYAVSCRAAQLGQTCLARCREQRGREANKRAWDAIVGLLLSAVARKRRVMFSLCALCSSVLKAFHQCSIGILLVSDPYFTRILLVFYWYRIGILLVSGLFHKAHAARTRAEARQAEKE